MRNDTPRTFVGTTTFSVTGLTCGHCERAVISEIAGVPGVDAVRVDHGSGVVTVTASRPVDRADIAQAVARAGFTLTG